MRRLIVFPALALLILLSVAGMADGTPAEDSAVGGGQTTPDELGFGLSAQAARRVKTLADTSARASA